MGHEPEGEPAEPVQLFVGEKGAVERSSLLSVEREILHAPSEGDSLVVVSKHATGAVRSQEVHARAGIGPVTYEVTESIHGINAMHFSEAQGGLESGEVGVDVG